jgi:hypothetical protein
VGRQAHARAVARNHLWSMSPTCCEPRPWALMTIVMATRPRANATARRYHPCIFPTSWHASSALSPLVGLLARDGMKCKPGVPSRSVLGICRHFVPPRLGCLPLHTHAPTTGHPLTTTATLHRWVDQLLYEAAERIFFSVVCSREAR